MTCNLCDTLTRRNLVANISQMTVSQDILDLKANPNPSPLASQWAMESCITWAYVVQAHQNHAFPPPSSLGLRIVHCITDSHSNLRP